MSDTTISVWEPKIFESNKFYRLIIEKDGIYGVYLANHLNSYSGLEQIISGVFALIWLVIFNWLFPFLASQAMPIEWARHLFIFVIFILAGRQLLNYLFIFLHPSLSKIENSKRDKYEKIVANALPLTNTLDLFLQQNKHNFIVERKDVLGVEINDKYGGIRSDIQNQTGQIIITTKNSNKKLLIEDTIVSRVKEIFESKSWKEF